MPVLKPRLLDEGYSENGLYHSVHDIGLRYTDLYKVHINGVDTYHRTKDAVKAYLQERGIVKIEDKVAEARDSVKNMLSALGEEPQEGSQDAEDQTGEVQK